MLLFPPFLGGVLLQAGMIQKGLVPMIAFCLASSATYIFNDIQDAAKDALHHTKKYRPIPSGRVTKNTAAIIAVVICTASIFLGFRLSYSFLFFLLIYMAVSVLYSLKLKEFPIVDLFCISAGFLFRLQAGGVVFGVEISEWLFLSVFLLSLFLSTGKRLCEKIDLGAVAGNHRKSLKLYPEGFLDGAMYLTGSAVLVTYTMYVIQRPSLVYTVPLCTFGLLRYIMRVKSGVGGDPTESLLKDVQLFVVGLVWVLLVGWSTYYLG
jgi:4-hydroxybenzoate polyprenyltransferase